MPIASSASSVSRTLSRIDATLNEEAVRAACKTGLANFKVPKRILFVGGTDWPRNAVGKISKDALIAQAVAGSAIDAVTARTNTRNNRMERI